MDEALKSLAKFDDRKSRIVELRFFGGLNAEETQVQTSPWCCNFGPGWRHPLMQEGCQEQRSGEVVEMAYFD